MITGVKFLAAQLALAILGAGAAFHPSVRSMSLASRIAVSVCAGAVALTLEAILFSTPAPAGGRAAAIRPNAVTVNARGKANYSREVHDVFVTALESVNRLVDPRALRAWLTQIAVFTARARIRRRVRGRILRYLPFSELPEPELPPEPEPPIRARVAVETSRRERASMDARLAASRASRVRLHLRGPGRLVGRSGKDPQARGHLRTRLAAQAGRRWAASRDGRAGARCAPATGGRKASRRRWRLNRREVVQQRQNLARAGGAADV